MHPAKSVIFFTVISGAGYGLLVAYVVALTLGWLPAATDLAIIVHGLAFLMVTAGLVSSTLHLGHPERAWRALSQWRTSWLSREGVAALFTFIPWAIFAYLWIVARDHGALTLAIGWVAAASALVTIYSTAMIYRSLKPIPAWSNPLTVPGYLLLGLANGFAILFATALIIGVADTSGLARVVHIIWPLALAIKFGYWRMIRRPGFGKPSGALGIPGVKEFRPLEAPHSAPNYLMREMIYDLARRRAGLLELLVYGLPLAMVGLRLADIIGGNFASLVITLAFLAATLIERWLFFAEARHVVSAYYEGGSG